MLAFRSLDPFRALREPDRRRRDEERLSRSEQRTLSKTQNNHLTGKAPYKSTANLTAEDVTGQHDRRSVPPRLEGSIGESLRTGLAAADPIPWSAGPFNCSPRAP